MNAALSSPILNLTTYEEVYIELWFYAKNEQAPPTYYDFGTLFIVNTSTSTATGIYLRTPAAEDMTLDATTINGWRRCLYRVPPAYRVSAAQFRIFFQSDSSVQREGLYIDNVSIRATTDVDSEDLGNDTYADRQYELKNVGQIANLGGDTNDLEVPEAWALTTVSTDVVVAVIDDGVELSHPDLNLVTGYNFDGVVGGGPSSSTASHGTACAGNVGAKRNNSTGVMGTAPGVKIMPVNNGSSSATMALAIDQAVLHGAKVLSNSWGWNGLYFSDIEDAIIDALSAGRTVVFAAGNGPDRSPWTYDVAFPGNLTATTDVICVGASSPTDEHKSASSSDGAFSWGSSYVGAGPDVCAPSPWSYTTDRLGALGYNDGTLIPDSDYTSDFGGTSSSTPKVAGIVALMLSANSSLTPPQVKAILKGTAKDMGTAGEDDRTGTGRVDAQKAVSAALNDAPVVTATVSALGYTENQSAVAVDPGLTVTDVDNTSLVGATVAITGFPG